MNSPMELRMPPCSIEAEQSLIGAMLIDDRAWDAVSDLVTEADFYRDDNRRIWRHISLLAGSGKDCGIISVFDSIQKSNEVEQCGGMAYIGEIANATPSAAAAKRYAQIVREKATLRRLIAASDQFSANCFQPGKQTTEELVSALEQQLSAEMDSSPDEPATISDCLSEALSYIDSRGDRQGLKTGIHGLDHITGGLDQGQLVLVAARPSVGKTAFACNVANLLAFSGKAGGFFTMEMTKREIGMRLLSSRSTVPVHVMRSGTKDDRIWSQMVAANATGAGQKLWVDETPSVTVNYIRSRARRMQRKHGLDFLIIDYLGLMRGKGDNRTQEIGSISRGLKGLAKELSIPIICLAQLNRGVEGRADKRPMLSDLRDSGEIEQDADIVMMLHREELYNQTPAWHGFAELLVRKNRNGPLGDVHLQYNGEMMTFSPWMQPFNPRASAEIKQGNKFRDD